MEKKGELRRAVKKPQTVQAYCLGDKSQMENLLVKEGAIKILPDGKYELFSQEAINGQGQIAEKGDYFKVDLVGGRHFPYPNSREYFEQHHRHLEGDKYELICSPVAIWQAADEMCEEIRFLLDTGRMTITPRDDAHYFTAELWGSQLSAQKDATVVFYRVERDEAGKILDADFNFVNAAYFRQNYSIL